MSYLFKTNNIYVLPILALFVFFLRGWSFVNPENIHHELYTLPGQFLMNLWLAGGYKVGLFIATLLLFIQAILFNLLLKKYEIIYRHTWMPAFIYIIAGSFLPGQFYSVLPIILNFLLLIVLHLLFHLYKSENPVITIFNLGIITGLGSLIQPEFLLLILLIIPSIFIIKILTIKDLFLYLVGMLTLYYFYGTALFLTNRLNSSIDLLLSYFKSPHFTYLKKYNYFNFFPVGLAFILFLLGVIKMSRNYMKNMLKIRKYQTVMLISLPVSLSIIAVGVGNFEMYFYFLAPSFSLLIAYYILGSNWGWWKELLLDILIGSIIYLQYTQDNL